MAKEKDTSTPLMKQYWEIKSAHGDKILFFRMGDFFEMFFDDAVTAAPLLGIALTSRNKKALDETPMCGLPHHSVAGPINKLLSLGYKVAICDQIEDPKMAKGIVKRAVTRILTPGMVFDNETLEATESHYMACLEKDCLAFIDPTTGESFYFKSRNTSMFEQLLQVLPVAELVVPAEDLPTWQNRKSSFILSIHSMSDDNNDLTNTEHKETEQNESMACLRLRSYIQSLGGVDALAVLKPFEKREWQHRMELSPSTLRHLEIYETYKGETKGSLFRAINRTQTSAGARLLRQWLAFPLRDLSILHWRLDHVEAWKQHLTEMKELRKQLATTGDIERRLSRLVTPQSQVRDLLSLAQATQGALAALEISKGVWKGRLNVEWLRQAQEQSVRMLKTFREDAPLSTRQGHLIQEGVSAELDEMIRLTQDTQTLLSEMEARERAETGINSLKIRYNNVFGYYIEITHTHKDKIPSHYQRKQTLANAERFCTEELIELEKKVLTAQSKRAELEWAIYDQIRREVIASSQVYLSLAHEIAEVDVLSSLSWLALEQNYSRPQFIDSINESSGGTATPHSQMVLVSARHPVVEQEISSPFIPNNINLTSGQCMLLTGPNMAGKSTLMRQVAVIAIMAQMGSFVPCEKAVLPLFDQVFTRIGASDHLSEGLSTFMVEMTEAADIIKKCTKDSLVVLDEIGRGTSTFDGLALAQSILEHLLTQKKSLTFFATHYHELTELENHYQNLFNYHMAVSEQGSGVQFLHTLIRGPALKSYGIYVAELAGLPSVVTRRAKTLLKQVEGQKVNVSAQLSFDDFLPDDGPSTMDARNKVCDEIKELPLGEITPIRALTFIESWQQKLNV